MYGQRFIENFRLVKSESKLVFKRRDQTMEVVGEDHKMMRTKTTTMKAIFHKTFCNGRILFISFYLKNTSIYLNKDIIFVNEHQEIYGMKSRSTCHQMLPQQH